MMEDPIVDLRIRFSGICLFVPSEDDRMDVYLPNKNHHEHVAKLYWRGTDRITTGQLLDGVTVTVDPGKGPYVPNLYNVHAWANHGLPGECPGATHGKVKPNPSRKAKVSLHRGSARIVNEGAAWVVPGSSSGKRKMPTVLDWWIHGLRLSEAAASISVQGAPAGSELDRLPQILADPARLAPGTPPILDLWVLHVPETEQCPRNITCVSVPGAGNGHHMLEYMSLLQCDKYLPVHTPEPPPTIPCANNPHWEPNEPTCEQGMLIDCMLAQAKP